MEKHPRISIIVPCLNEEKFVGALLDSLNKQTILRGLLEVIIADNGSTDATLLEVWRRAEDLSFGIKIVHELKKGVSRARNTGAASARGKYLVFLDADNTVSEAFCASLLSVTNRTDLGGATIATLAGDNSLRGQCVFLILEAIKRFGSRPFGKSVVSKSVWRECGGYHNDIVLGENVDFLIRVKRCCERNGLRFSHVWPPIKCSLRRFSHEGYFRVLNQWLKAYLGEWRMPYAAMSEIAK
jgi:glycosyltransferase involved in cell wall biosynthesis